jgi:uncharacterized lipoprotein YbaY
VTGDIVITAGVPAFQGATAHIWLEDISRADGEARRVAETVLQDIRHQPPGGTFLPFVLHAPSGSIDPRNDYAVRVWLDQDGDGQEGPGDLYSDQSYRVLTRGFGRNLNVALGPSAQTPRGSDGHGGQ